MILHYIKIALRNIAKYKTQNFISIVSIAVAVMFFTGVWSIVERSVPTSHWDEDPDYERTFIVSDDNKSLTPAQFTLLDTVNLTCAKKIFADCKQQFRESVFFLEQDSLYTHPLSYMYKITTPDFLANTHAYSAVTGQAIGLLEEGTVVMDESLAQMTFGTKNVIGRKIKMFRYYSVTGNNEISTMCDKNISTYTIADVKQNDNWNDSAPTVKTIYVPGEYYDNDGTSYVVLKEGFTQCDLRSQLQELFPSSNFWISPSMLDQHEHIENSGIAMRSILYTLCTLILSGALLGFLRMQIQLFGLRHREIALRTVLGGTTSNLWLQLTSEIAVILMLTAALAYMLVLLLKDYLQTNLAHFLTTFHWDMGDFETKALWLIGLVILVTVATVSVSLHRIKAKEDGLSLQMRPNRSHIGRNVSIGFQMVLSTLLITFCLFLTDAYKLIKEGMGLGIASTEKLDRCVSVPGIFSYDTGMILSTQEKALAESDLAESYTRYRNVSQSLYPQLAHNDKKNAYIRGFNQPVNGGLEKILDIQVTPLETEPLPDETLTALVSESLYRKLLSDSTLSPGKPVFLENKPRRITGTYKTLPYIEEKELSVILCSDSADFSLPYTGLMVLAKPGCVSETRKLLTGAIPPEIQVNFRNSYSTPKIDIYNEGGRTLCNIISMIYSIAVLLTFISIVSSGASLYSTVQLDTRRRQKEVAMRKINGATQKNIALLFAKKYITITAICFVFCIPLCIFFSMAFIPNGNEISTPHLIKFLSFTTLGITAVTALTIGFHIRRIMRINPAEIIKTE